MEQPTGPIEGNPFGITGFWPMKCSVPLLLWEFWFNSFQLGMVATNEMNPKNFFFDGIVTATQVAAVPGDVNGKNRTESEHTLVSILFLCLGEKGQDEHHKRRPHFDLG